MMVSQRGTQELGVRYLTSLVDVDFFNEALHVFFIDIGIENVILIDRLYFSKAILHGYSASVVHIDQLKSFLILLEM